MNREYRIQSLIEMERPLGHQAPEEIKKLVHLNDNMVRRVTIARGQKQRQAQHKA